MLEKDRVLKAAEDINHHGSNFRIVFHHPDYLNGSLFAVEFDTSNGVALCYVYSERGQTNVCTSQALLNELVARKSKKTGVALIMEGIGGMAGIIGLCITVTIIYLVISRPESEIPQILSTALTAILGFYFGSKASK